MSKKNYSPEEYKQLKQDAYGMDISVEELIFINSVIDEVREERMSNNNK